MLLLGAGVAVFIGAHLLPSLPGVRERLIERVGFNRYRGLFSLMSLLGLALIVLGMRAAPMVPLWNPPGWAFTITVVAMPLAFILLACAYLPTNLKRLTRHPMLWAVALWAGLHLLSNGDLASLVLFGSFGAFALFDMASANRRGAELSRNRLPFSRDLLPIAVGLAAYALFLYYHQTLFGRSVLPYWNALWA